MKKLFCLILIAVSLATVSCGGEDGGDIDIPDVDIDAQYISASSLPSCTIQSIYALNPALKNYLDRRYGSSYVTATCPDGSATELNNYKSTLVSTKGFKNATLPVNGTDYPGAYISRGGLDYDFFATPSPRAGLFYIFWGILPAENVQSTSFSAQTLSQPISGDSTKSLDETFINNDLEF